MAGIFQGDQSSFSPRVCEYWQMHRIPRSPLPPLTRFLRWIATDSEENYYKRGNKEFSVVSVGYDFNSLGYRGPEFELRPGEVGVMFLGDSNTLGIGIPWEGLWTSLVVKRLEERWGVSVRQFNLGWGGTGSDYAAMMVHQTVEVLNPAAVFVLWSFVERMTWFADTRRQVHFRPHANSCALTDALPRETSNLKEHSAYLRLATEAQGFFNYVRNFHFINDRLSRLGIPYYWGNLEQFSEEMLAPYLPLEGYAGRWKKMDFARDGLHAGLKSHASFAGLVISAIERDKVSPATQSHDKSRILATSVGDAG